MTVDQAIDRIYCIATVCGLPLKCKLYKNDRLTSYLIVSYVKSVYFEQNNDLFQSRKGRIKNKSRHTCNPRMKTKK